ncbi:hypothetical protein AURDEDRAFT_154281 [Auricularia subglabra TFB-10046 SS5]|uniref:Uncharacterized protein n=1 Tax=Auricularia subglabra (strain TFB-10046 / SS5) TaxID=717982 RepID=J0LHT7_AURST|nr:hypothetical protein AURDEDRAFT_154281 [Auricularia subglabra TFB-10046 SS5]
MASPTSPSFSRNRSTRAGSHAPPPNALKLSPKDYAADLRSHGLRSPCTPSPVRDTKPKTPTSPSFTNVRQSTPDSRLQAFRDDWERLIHPGHTNLQEGLDILDGLVRTPNLEKPRGIAQYNYVNYTNPARPSPNLSKLIQIDLNKVHFNDVRVLSDQRTKPSKLLDSDDMRSALSEGLPIVVYVPPGECGMLDARVDVPGFRFEKCGPTLVAGQGAFSLARQSHGHQSVYTQAIGQCVVLDFPVTPENREGLPRSDVSAKDFGRIFAWASEQPGACVRVLHPGDNVFLPALQGRLTISLGHKGSNFSATAHSYFAPDYSHDSDDERQRKRPRTDHQ